MTDLLLLTDEGKKRLADLLRRARAEAGLSMDGLRDRFLERFEVSFTTSAISDLENGKRDPQWDTLAKVAALGYVRHGDGRPYTVCELFLVACEAVTEEPMFSIVEAASILGITPRRLQIRAKDEGWRGVQVPGTKWKRYPLSCFPVYHQERLRDGRPITPTDQADRSEATDQGRKVEGDGRPTDHLIGVSLGDEQRAFYGFA